MSRTADEFETFENLPFDFTKDELEFFNNPEINQVILKKALEERTGRPVWLNPPNM